MAREKLSYVMCAVILAFGLAGTAVQADVYSDLGAIHNTGLAPTGYAGTVTGGNEATAMLIDNLTMTLIV